MTEPTKRIDGIRQQACAIDDESTLVSVIGYDLMSAALWIVERDGQAKHIGGTSPGCPKIDSAFPRAFPDGTARLCLAQADPGGGGATSHLTWIDFPDAFPPQSSIVAGGTFVQAPGGAITVYNAPLDGGVSIDLAQHGIPSASCYSYQIQVVAPVAGRRAFVGSGGPAYANVQAIAQVPGVESSVCGIAAPGAHHTLVVNADAGALNSCQVYILGWWV